MKTAILSLFFLSGTFLQAAFDHSHKAFTSVLGKYVEGNNVDYAALKKSPDRLGAYLVNLSEVSKSDYSSWSDNQKKAFLINLYNAATLKLIIDNYPVKSIKDIGSPWKLKTVKAFGKAMSLDTVEHEMLRKDFNDPRIHFGVNCASVGCPPLREEAFTADKLDRQLDEQARAFLADSSKNKIDPKNGTMQLSPIFDWFEGDFVKKSGSVQKFVTPFLPGKTREAIGGRSMKISHTNYDWSLNDA